jgi:phosphoglycerate dehydrogenase-like enzyme
MWPNTKPLNILSLVHLLDTDAERIRAADTRVELVLAGGWFSGEYATGWPKATADRYISGKGSGTRAERDQLLAKADVVIAGFPFPTDLVARAPNLRWMHQTPAGASNLRRGDIWGSSAAVTTSRGHGETTAIAEYAIASISFFAKGFHQAVVDRQRGAFDHRAYGVRSLETKTLCVIGAGGIGQEVARLGANLGMHVTGTRRRPEAEPEGSPFTQLRTPEYLHELLGSADYVAVCCQWTDETTNLLDASAFAAMKDGAIVTNVARGEIIDESALLAALDSGKVRGAALDVYVGEFEHTPPPALWEHPSVLITPHTSAQTDNSRRRSTEVFLTNLEHFLAGESLHHQVDWSRGY